MRSNRFVTATSLVVFALFLVARTYSVFNRPITTFDTMMYVSLLHHGSQDAMSEAVKTCAQEVPGPVNNCSANGTPEAYPKVSNYSPQDYATFIRFYTVKPLYLWTAEIVKRAFHLEDFMSLRVVSIASFLLIGLVLAVWLQECLSVPLACLLSALAISIPDTLHLGSYLLPDCFSTALLLLVLYLTLYKVESLPFKLLLLATVTLARPDNIIFCTVYGTVLLYRAFASKRKFLGGFIVFFIACFLLHILLQRLTQGLSYTLLFNQSFHGLTAPSTFPAQEHLNLNFYFHTVLRNGYVTVASFLVVPAIFALFTVLNPFSSRALKDLVMASTVVLVFRIILFPGMEERYYVWYFLIALTCSACALGQQRRSTLLSDSALAAIPVS